MSQPPAPAATEPGTPAPAPAATPSAPIPAPARYPGQRPLAALIRLYRRRLSGRGPLHRVRCTFERTESCSAYGLRATTTVARSAPEAIRLIRARIRACGHSALYRIPLPAPAPTREPTPTGEPAQTSAPASEPAPAPTSAGEPAQQRHGLLWGEAFDQGMAAHDAALRAAGELPATRAAVLRAHALIAHHAHDPATSRRALHAAHRLHPGHARLLVRAGARLPARLRRRLLARILTWTALAALLCVLTPSWLAIPLTLAALFPLLSTIQAHIHRLRRLDHQAAASRFHAPPRIPAGARAGALPLVPVLNR